MPNAHPDPSLPPNRHMHPIVLFTYGLLCTTIIGWMLVQLRDILVPILLTLVFWFILNSLANWIRSFRLGSWQMSRWFSLLISTCIVIYAGALCINLVAENIAEFAADSTSHEATIISLLEYIDSLLPENFSLWPGDKPPNLAALVPDLDTQQLLQWSASLLSDASSFGGLVLVYLIFFFIEQANFEPKFQRLFHTKNSYLLANDILESITFSIGKYTRIMLIVNFLQGIFTYFALIWLGIDYPAFWGFLAFVMNFIPTIGTIISVLMPVLMSIVQTGDLMTVLLTTVVLSAIQFTIGTVIGPKMLGDSLNLSSLVVMFALAVWGAAWGVIGMFLAVPITVMIMIICANFKSTEKIAILLSDNGDFSQMLRNQAAKAHTHKANTEIIDRIEQKTP